VQVAAVLQAPFELPARIATVPATRDAASRRLALNPRLSILATMRKRDSQSESSLRSAAILEKARAVHPQRSISGHVGGRLHSPPTRTSARDRNGDRAILRDRCQRGLVGPRAVPGRAAGRPWPAGDDLSQRPRSR
jgi:hypothetical protein